MTDAGKTELPVLSLVQALHGLSSGGCAIEFVATESERERLAEALGLLGITALSANLLLDPVGKGAHLSGQMAAQVVQACVVTLEPVTQNIEETIEVDFSPGDSEPEGREIVEIDPESPDPPDPIVAGVIDVGQMIEEHLGLALDPYPRREDATIPADYRAEPAAASDSPFAGLAAMRDGDTDESGNAPTESKD